MVDERERHGTATLIAVAHAESRVLVTCHVSFNFVLLLYALSRAPHSEDTVTLVQDMHFLPGTTLRRDLHPVSDLVSLCH
jgi:hypothetical protein